jgi:hypothetical protein
VDNRQIWAQNRDACGTHVLCRQLGMSCLGSGMSQGSNAKNAHHDRGTAAAVGRMGLTPPLYGALNQVDTLLRADAPTSKGLARWANSKQQTANHVLG